MLEQSISYQWVEKEQLEEYKEVILPFVLEEMYSQMENTEVPYFCIGARIQEKVVGAIVAEGEPIGSLIILSLYVLPAYRQKGIGSTLLKKGLDVAYCSYQFEEEEEEISYKIQYSLSDEAEQILENFLKKNGFTDFATLGMMYWLDSDDLKKTDLFSFAFEKEYSIPDKIKEVSFLPKEEQQELMLSIGAWFSPEYSFVIGEADARDAVVLIEKLDSVRFKVHLAQTAPEVSNREWMYIMGAAISKIYKEHAYFQLVMECWQEDIRKLLNLCMIEKSYVTKRKAAWVDVMFRRN